MYSTNRREIYRGLGRPSNCDQGRRMRSICRPTSSCETNLPLPKTLAPFVPLAWTIRHGLGSPQHDAEPAPSPCHNEYRSSKCIRSAHDLQLCYRAFE
jgi:hypothetical protein